jgi:hypothetical protein
MYGMDSSEDDIKKDELLQMLTLNKGASSQLAIAEALIMADAKPDMRIMNELLLHTTDASFVEKLLKNYGSYDDKDYVTGKPIFFNAQTTEIAKLFFDNGVDVNMFDGNGYNVLWHIIDAKFPAELMNFYIQQKVDVTHICPFDGSCILHSFAANKEVIDAKDFLTKAQIILINAYYLSCDMSALKDQNGKTPLEVARETREYWGEKYPACVKPLEELEKLIGLFKPK